MQVKLFSKSILFSMLTLLVSANTYAALPGMYLGAQVGWGKGPKADISNRELRNLIAAGLGDSDFTIVSTSNPGRDGTGTAGRVFLGYQGNPFWALEAGWTRFPNVTVTSSAIAVDTTTGFPITANATSDIRPSAFDLVAKGIWPLPCAFGLYGKLGLAYLTADIDQNVTVTEVGLSNTVDQNRTEHRYYPTFGLGVSYDFSGLVVADVSWNRIQKVGSSGPLRSTDLVSAGLVLHFG